MSLAYREPPQQTAVVAQLDGLRPTGQYEREQASVPAVQALLPLDESKHANRAVEYLIAWQSRVSTNIEVWLLNVQPPIPDSASRRERRRLWQAGWQRGRRLLSAARLKIEAAGITCTDASVRHGTPADTIIRHATRMGCDMIIMGTRGMDAMGNLVRGSVATAVVAQSAFPVLLLR